MIEEKSEQESDTIYGRNPKILRLIVKKWIYLLPRVPIDMKPHSLDGNTIRKIEFCAKMTGSRTKLCLIFVCNL